MCNVYIDRYNSRANGLWLCKHNSTSQMTEPFLALRLAADTASKQHEFPLLNHQTAYTSHYPKLKSPKISNRRRDRWLNYLNWNYHPDFPHYFDLPLYFSLPFYLKPFYYLNLPLILDLSIQSTSSTQSPLYLNHQYPAISHKNHDIEYLPCSHLI